MMFSELSFKIQEYLNKGQNFAIAQVINREAPSSGKIGDKAIILETGELIGWIGGGCVRGIVIKEAIEVIKTKRYKRVRISPDGGISSSNHLKNYVMSCQSGGTVELLIEPIFPQPELIVIGRSNIARKLVAIASTADFKVTAMASDADKQMFPLAFAIKNEVNFDYINSYTNKYIIVATQGESDEESVKKSLLTPAHYVGFVSSEKKSKQIKDYLTDEKISKDRIQQLKSPVGIDINAKLASEVAISILAEIIDHFRNGNVGETMPADHSQMGEEAPTTTPAEAKFAEDYYINPVCNIPISKKNPKHIIEYKGEKVYFCCDGCKVSFEKKPSQYFSKK